MTEMPDAPADDLAERMHMSPQAMRSLGYRVVDLLVEHWARLEEKPVTRVADRAHLDVRLRTTEEDLRGTVDKLKELGARLEQRAQS